MALFSRRQPARTRASSKAPPRVVIEQVSPQVDCGRHPSKRVLGDVLRVSAAIFKEGHDRVLGRVAFRAPSPARWQRAAMQYDYDTDSWSAEIALDRLGRWSYRVEAWTDDFGTWRAELEIKLAAGLDMELEVAEGAQLVRGHAARARGRVRQRLEAFAAMLADSSRPSVERARAALDESLAQSVRSLEPTAVTRHGPDLEVVVDPQRAQFGAWYEMFPRSQTDDPAVHGTLRSAARSLPRLAALGFDVVYLPPIHPIGRTNRKGKDNRLTARPDDPGSPWAIGGAEGGHTAVHPELGTLEDLEVFVERARELGLEVALDYALQCSPDHPWVREHPEWFQTRPDGTIRFAENPPKKYEDIGTLDFWCEDRAALWRACRDVVLFWIERGVRIFRVDNPHTKPFAFWEWMIADVQARHPGVILLSEAFTRPNRMRALAKLGFTMSYTYFTWKNTSTELREYFTELTSADLLEYYRPNLFVNTPDILHEYLQEGGRPAFRARLLLAGTLAPNYGIYSGFELIEREPRHPGSEEYLHSEKYEIRVRDWNAAGNLDDDIRLMNRIRREHPALQRFDNLRFAESTNDQVLAYLKSSPGDELLVTVNLDPHRSQDAFIELPDGPRTPGPNEVYGVHDLLTGHRYTWRGRRNWVRLDPREQVAHLFEIRQGDGA